MHCRRQQHGGPARAAGALRAAAAAACGAASLAAVALGAGGGCGSRAPARARAALGVGRAVLPCGISRPCGPPSQSQGLAASSPLPRRPSRPRRKLTCAAASFGDLFGTRLPEGHDSTVIWLHGLGDTGRGWTDVAGPQLRGRLPRTRFLFPTAPTQPVTVNMGASMPSWFDINTLDLELFSMNPPGLADSAEYVCGLVQRQLDAGVAPERIVLAGFSQGGAVALAATVGSSCSVGGVLMLSTFVASTLPERLEGLPCVHFFHGEDDDMVPITWGRKSCEILQARGVQATFRSYQGLAHSACLEEMQDISDVLVDILNPQPAAG
uniref:Phospholipase/carboxylesterase/thioesterase domain-containing protein n=1 Tax=Pyrodinium bahamense TaxID=73915 RepID=A0A7S0FGT1_9DINO|mmetsp:Transcript_29537/g.81155  ORF Transcript_29537/g.81155 Transcript_29537/m.81155 type:complete len:324 (+) Transcript_29537:94-1065(+)